MPGFQPELIPLIEAEVNKLIEVGFIREVKYPMWILSVVLVRKQEWANSNATMDHEDLSFMDGSSINNQILMAPADEELTAFHTPKGIYCYKVMPFGPKNVGAIYRRVMQRIFNDMLHKNVECYVDELVVKSKKRENHLHDLRKVFERLRRYQLKIPCKCAFGVTSRKFFEFIIRQRGRPLILYVAAQERSVGILLAQKNDEGKENVLDSLSRTMTPNELKYSLIENFCLALIFAIQKLKHYFQSHSIHLVSKANPFKDVMTKLVLSDRLARWYLQLQ
ncbi:UNVERIFIED_CONTAM: hypothetical protein Slati_2704900 [Sesamum latifolium]|uniref:Reverse transcriptase n=1 Tax=Sesamum latifolium TaxID=2727402 RepID=A0AAW2W0K7_9LAMI